MNLEWIVFQVLFLCMIVTLLLEKSKYPGKVMEKFGYSRDLFEKRELVMELSKN